ncbi:MAG TPA: cupin domain-containing protein [Chitinophagales bacterium]|nr:cupin domain-containing protein [Chitinophagales bacterium]
MRGREYDFLHLVAPLTETQFYSEFYEKKVCNIKRNQADYYKNLLSVELLDNVLYSQPLIFPRTKLVNAAYDLPLDPKLYTSDQHKIHKAKFLKHFSEGSTMVFSGLHDHLPSLGLFCSYMSKYFSHEFQTNVYCTPPNSQGFKTHYDTHDVFILQIEGSKKWRFYESPIQLPLKTQPFIDHKPGKLQQEVILRAGDLLYIPRGIMHDAISNNELSIHITAGLLGYTWSDFLVEAVLDLAHKDFRFRKNLPIGFGNKRIAAKAKPIFQELMNSFASKTRLTDGFERFYYEFISHKNPNLPGQLRQIMLLSNISCDSTVQRLTNVIFKISENSKKIIIHLFGQNLEFPAFTKPAIRFLEQHEVFKISELPNCMNDKGKIVFAKRLVKEGLLHVLH